MSLKEVVEHQNLPELLPDYGAGKVDDLLAQIGYGKVSAKQVITKLTPEAEATGGGTATEAVIKDRDKQARLIVWAGELKDAIELALQYTGQLMSLGEDAGGEIVLRTKWVIKAEQAQMVADMRQRENEASIAKMKAGAGAAA